MGNPIQPFSSAQQIAQMPDISAGPSAGGGTDFLQTLDGMLNQVGNMQTDAQQQVSDLLQSDGQDVHSAMIAV